MSPLLHPRRDATNRVLTRSNGLLDPEGEAILRDTDHLVLRSADITLATANSAVLEEMIAEGQQFDWVIVEEAARASGLELIGALLLGNRRVLIGDHHQLAPFDAERKARLYAAEVAGALLADAIQAIDVIPDLPDAVKASLESLDGDPSLRADVLAAAARLEQPFREIVETAEDALGHGQAAPVSMLTEQSRMHPAICALVSDTFYCGRLTTAERIAQRPQVIGPTVAALAAPIVVFDLPSLSVAKVRAFEEFDRTSPFNRAEAAAVLEALDRLSPIAGVPSPTLAILSLYTA